LIENKVVYIDIDDYGSTTYNRMVGVAYLRYNSTHLLNVNKELLDKGYAIVWDYSDNEFNPSTWTEYAYYPASTENILQLLTNNTFRFLLESLIIILAAIGIISLVRALF
jgi:adenine-specific DNA methylase